MVNYFSEGGVKMPALYSDKVLSGRSSLEKALQDAANTVGLSVEYMDSSDKLTASRYTVEKEVSETAEKGFFKKKPITTITKFNVGTIYIGLTPMSTDAATSSKKCPIYLVNAMPWNRYHFLEVHTSHKETSDKELDENFQLLKQLGMEIHRKLGNDVVLETATSWDMTIKEGFAKEMEQLRTCEYCGLGTFMGKSCRHCGAP